MRNIIYLLPNGPKNLSPLFPTINWDDIEEYYINLAEQEGVELFNIRDFFAQPFINKPSFEALVNLMQKVNPNLKIGFMESKFSDDKAVSIISKNILLLRRDDLCLTRQLSLLYYYIYFQPYFLHLLPFRLLYIMQEKKLIQKKKHL